MERLYRFNMRTLSRFKWFRKLHKGTWYYVCPIHNNKSDLNDGYWINRVPYHNEMKVKKESYY